jgi:hypothetical protein
VGDIGLASLWLVLVVHFLLHIVWWTASSISCRFCCTPHSCRDISSMVEEVSIAVVSNGREGQYCKVHDSMYELVDLGL